MASDLKQHDAAPSDARFSGRPITIWPTDGPLSDPEPTRFQKILLSTDGTVTELLSLHADAPIRARKVAQSLGTAAAPPVPGSAPHELILRRTILLGTGAGPELLFADSCFVFDRFSASIQHDLLHTELPVGLLWRRERLEMYREIIDRRRETCAAVAALLGTDEHATLYSRTYLIYYQQRALGVITEKFAATALR